MITLRTLVDRWEELVASEATVERASGTTDWDAAVVEVARGVAGPSLLMRIAEQRGKPAAWVRERLAKDAAVQDRDLAEERARARAMLLDDRVRLEARPELELARWQREARPLDELDGEPLAALGRAVARSVLVAPRADRAQAVVGRLAGATPTDDAEQAAVIDAVNALECAGVALPDELRARIRTWLPASRSIGAVLAAAPLAAFQPYRTIRNDLHASARYLAAAVHAHAVVATVEPALDHLAETLDGGVLDEASALWFARAAWHELDERPLAEIATRAHAWLWGIAAALETARVEARARVRSFPLDRTIGAGAYRIERSLQGTGAQRLYAGVEVATGSRVQIAFDDHSPGRQDPAELHAAVAYDAPGLLELLHVGALDDEPNRWALVERVTGAWLPHVIRPGDRADIAAQAERIARAAAEHGIDLTGLRPELMWAERRGETLELTGLSTRALALFRRSRADARSHALFDSPTLAPPDAIAALAG